MRQERLVVDRYHWFHEFGFYNKDNVGMEALTDDNNNEVKFDQIRIVIESGIYYVTLYGCACLNNQLLINGFISWLDMLKSTDVVKLSVSSTRMDVPVIVYSNLLAALKRCKARVEIQLDTIVFDSLAYFYVACPYLKLGSAGALMIPSYTDKDLKYKTPREQASLAFVSSLVNEAFDRAVISSEDRDKLHSGQAVVVDKDKLRVISI